MARAQGPKVRITKEQLEDYIKLVQSNRGKLRSEAILQIQQKYNLPEPHKRQAVMRRLWRKEKREGIVILVKRKGQAKVMAGAESGIPELSLDKGIEIMLTAFERAKEYPVLVAELEKYKRGYNNLLEAAKTQEKAEQKSKEQEIRFKLAQQQGEIYKLNNKKQKVVSH